MQANPISSLFLLVKILKQKPAFLQIEINYFTRTIFEILEKNNSPKIINYLSLDVEGSETVVLKNFPFNKYIFESMTIERPSKELNKILFKNGYLFVKNFKADTFYIHNSLLKKKNIDIKFEDFKQLPKKKW